MNMSPVTVKHHHSLLFWELKQKFIYCPTTSQLTFRLFDVIQRVTPLHQNKAFVLSRLCLPHPPCTSRRHTLVLGARTASSCPWQLHACPEALLLVHLFPSF